MKKVFGVMILAGLPGACGTTLPSAPEATPVDDAVQTVVAKDGYPQQPWQCDTLNIAPGDRWDVIVEPDEAGVWAFHCHILPHVEGPQGMFGMVTALIVQ